MLRISYFTIKRFIDIGIAIYKFENILSSLGLELTYLVNLKKFYSQFYNFFICNKYYNFYQNSFSYTYSNSQFKINSIFNFNNNNNADHEYSYKKFFMLFSYSKLLVLLLLKFTTESSYTTFSNYTFLPLLNSFLFIDYIFFLINKSISISYKIFNEDIIFYIDFLYNTIYLSSLYSLSRELIFKFDFKPSIKYLDISLNYINSYHHHFSSFIVKTSLCYNIFYCLIFNSNNNIFFFNNNSCQSIANSILKNLFYDIDVPLQLYDFDKIHGNIRITFSDIGQTFTSVSNIRYYLPHGIIILKDNLNIISIASALTSFFSKTTLYSKNVVVEFIHINIYHFKTSIDYFNINSIFLHRCLNFNNYIFLKNSLYYFISILLKYIGGYIYMHISNSSNIKYLYNIFINKNKIYNIVGANFNFNILKIFFFKLGFYNIYNIFFKIPKWNFSSFYNKIIIFYTLRYIYSSFYKLNVYLSSILQNTNLLYNINNINNIKILLINRDFYEIISFSFFNSYSFHCIKQYIYIYIYNPLSSKYYILRTTLIPGVLFFISNNIHSNFTNISFFEIGKIYYFHYQFIEENVLSLFRTNSLRHIKNYSRIFNFFDLKDDILFILNYLYINIRFVYFKIYKNNMYSRSIIIYYHNIEIAILGLLSIYFTNIFCIHQNVFCCELYLERFYKKQSIYSHLSLDFNSSVCFCRNFSFLIKNTVLVDDILNTISFLKLHCIYHIDILNIHHLYQKYKTVAFSLTVFHNSYLFSKNCVMFLSNKIITLLCFKFNALLNNN